MLDDQVTFRPARRGDVPAIVCLLADDQLSATREDAGDELPDAYWKAYEEIAADPRNSLIVAELAEELVGTLQLTFIPGLSYTGGERAQIESVRVAEPYRGRGLGRALIGWAVDQAKARGCRLVQLTSNKQRSEALRFYESLGFSATHQGLKLDLGG